MTLTLILATLLVQPQTVTFTHPCDRAEIVLEALGKELGTPIKPSGSVHQDFFLVRFEDVPVQEALDKIATTLNATWSVKSGVRYLGRTHRQDLEDAKAGQSYVGDEIRKWIEKRKPKQEYTLAYAEQLLKQAIPMASDPEGNNSDALRALGDQSPLSRLVTRIVSEIDIDELASLKMGESMQYATNPNASQRPLPKGDALKMFEQENFIHKAALDKTGAIEQLGTRSMWSSLIQPYRFQIVESERVKLTLVRDIGSLQVRLSIGRVSANQSIRMDRPEGEGVPKQLTSSTDVVEWSPLTVQFVEVLMPMMTGQTTDISVPQELQETFSDPVKNEFLNYFGSKWILDTAVKQKLNVVALLSDDSGFISMLGAAQKMTEGQLWAMLPSLEASYDFKLENGWLTFAPNKRAETREIRIDREVLRRSIQLHKRDKGATIDSMAMMFSASDHELYSMFSTLIGGIATNDPSIIVSGQTLSPDLLRMYNQLPSSQKAQAHNGGVSINLPYGNKKFNYYMNKVIFGDRSQLQPNARKDIWPNSSAYRILGQEGDPFDQLGNGFPRGSTAKFMVIERDLLYPQPNQQRTPNGYTADALAQRIVSTEAFQQQRNSNFDRVLVSKAQRLVVEFSFPGLGFVYADAQLDHLPKKIEYKPLASLPQNLKTEVESAMKKYREMYKNATVGGARVIPPSNEVKQ